VTIIQWAQKILQTNNTPTLIQKTPWSDIQAFDTAQGKFFLKHTSNHFALEPFITQKLHDEFDAHVPHVLAINNDLHCFLMIDAGIRLRDYQPADIQLDRQAIQYYQAIQKNSENYIEDWITFGIPDWRLDKLPALYHEFIGQEDFLAEQGVFELNELQKLTPTLTALCEQLNQLNIPQTLDHCDFHDRNILIHLDTKALTIIDWPETVITHPYFSWINYLKKSTYAQADLFSPEPKAWELANKIWPVYAVLAFYRLIQASDQEAFKAYYATRPNRIAGYLREWISCA